MSKFNLDFDSESADSASSSVFTGQYSSIDTLIKELNQLKEQMSQLQYEQSIQSGANMVTPQFNQASTHLMLKTAEITKDLSLTEKNAPYLTSPSQKSYHVWRPSFKYYKKQNGSKNAQDLMSEDVSIYYGYIFNVQLSSISSDVLLQKLDIHHKVVLDDMAILESNLKMEKSKDYKRSNLKDYAKSFIFVLDRYPHI